MGDDTREREAPGEVRTFGHYVLLKELGRGAQGIVYLAEDSTLHRKVALKMLAGAGAESEDSRERFRREATLASKLEHPGICGVHEFGVEAGIPFIAMQYVTGTTLAEMIAAGGDVHASREGSGTSLTGKDALQDVLRILGKTAEALHTAHEAGLIHRDIKPANIMVTEGGRPVILDFGLARDMSDAGHTLTQSGQALGTPAYMAAEQLLGKRDDVDRRTDVYALGVTLYEALTLRRPYEAEGFEQLYQLILQGVPANPCKLNQRIPKDLGTIVEVATDREPGRRYATAQEFADDLRRVRSFEPIQAKAAGSWTRSVKWMKRNPAPSVAMSAIALFVFSGSGVFFQQEWQRRAEVDVQLVAAERALEAEEPTRALEALTLVRERDPDSQRALELSRELEALRLRLEREAREAEDRADAAEARREASGLQREHAKLRFETERLRLELEADRPLVFASHAPLAERAGFARRERELRALDVESERLLQEAREALERAARLEAPWGASTETRAAFATYYLSRWQEATSSGDADRIALYREAVERYDPEQEFRTMLLGRGTLEIDVQPSGAELYLFRYEPYGDLRPGHDVPRLVPVPTTGIGRARELEWTSGFAPGDLCLAVESVEPGAAGDSAGLEEGDLVLFLAGQPAAEALFLCAVPGAPPEALPARVLTVEGVAIRDRLDWMLACAGAEGDGVRLRVSGFEDELELAADELRPLTGAELLRAGCSSSRLRVDCLRAGEPLSLELERDQGAGLHCATTAYPLIRSSENLVEAGRPLTLDPGSYLLLARAPGHEELRLPLVLPRLGTLECELDLSPVGTTPPGFVRIPAGSFQAGGDEQAKEPAPPRDARVEEFWISRRELSNAEWLAFLEDPAVAARIEESGDTRYLPRETSGPMPRENLGGPGTPVMGITHTDLTDYLTWRNARAVADGEPWRYDLPTELEWEKAARGVDGRAYPWGSRFDYAATIGLHSRAKALYDAPGGFEPRDESPYGLLDTGGHRREWTRDWFEVDPEAPPLFRTRGGSWRYAREQDFRVSSRQYSEPDFTSATLGARLVARLRE